MTKLNRLKKDDRSSETFARSVISLFYRFCGLFLCLTVILKYLMENMQIAMY